MIKALYNDDRFKDFTIFGKDCEVKVHKAVLAISDIEYFKILSNSAVGNSFAENYLKTDLNNSSLNCLVNFIYGNNYIILNIEAEETRETTFSDMPNFKEVYEVIDRFLCNSALEYFKNFLEYMDISSIPIELVSDFFEICCKTQTKCYIDDVKKDYLRDLIYVHHVCPKLLAKIISNEHFTEGSYLAKEVEKIFMDERITLEIFVLLCDDPRRFPFILISKLFIRGFMTPRTFAALSIIVNHKLKDQVEWYRKNDEEVLLEVEYGINLVDISNGKFNLQPGYDLIKSGIYKECYVVDDNNDIVDMDYGDLTHANDGWSVIGVL